MVDVFFLEDAVCETTASLMLCKLSGLIFPPNGFPHEFFVEVACELNSQTGFDFRASQDCKADMRIVNENGEENYCRAIVCPAGFGASPISFACGGMLGDCNSVDCNFQCDGPCWFGCEDAQPGCRLCEGEHEHDGHDEEDGYYDYEGEEYEEKQEENMPP